MDDKEARAAAVNAALQMARDGGHCFDDAQELVAASRTIYDFLVGMPNQAMQKVMVRETTTDERVRRQYFFTPPATIGKTDPFGEAVKIATGTNNE